jgi:aspartate 4-decarboxylase
VEPSAQEVARRYAQLSPFQLKDELIKWARSFARGDAATHAFLDAGRGNPNWVATTPREAFFLLGQFALEESKRVWDEQDIGGMPHAPGSAERFRAFLSRADGAGAVLLRRGLDYGISKLGFDADAFVHELTDALIGDNYPVPDRMLVHAEAIVGRYLAREMRRPSPAGALRSVRGRGRHRRYVLHVRQPDGERHPPPRGHHRARDADLHAVPRDP